MKKSICLLLLAGLLAAPLAAQREDVVVLWDTSVSVLPIFRDFENRLVRGILDRHINEGDTFTIISFADQPEVEIYREIRRAEDIETIREYLPALQPMGQHTDLIKGLRFLYQFVLDLPPGNKKNLVILTDGIHDPPPSSPFAYGRQELVLSEIRALAEAFKKEGWNISLLTFGEAAELQDGPVAVTGQEEGSPASSTGLEPADTAAKDNGKSPEEGVTPEESPSTAVETAAGGVEAGPSPAAHGVNSTEQDDASASLSPEPSSGTSKDPAEQQAVVTAMEEGLGVESRGFNPDEKELTYRTLGIPKLLYPSGVVRGREKLKTPFQIINHSRDAERVTIEKVFWNNRNTLNKPLTLNLRAGETKSFTLSLTIPGSEMTGVQQAHIQLVSTGSTRIAPLTGSFSFEMETGSGSRNRLFWIAGSILLLLLLGILLLRKRGSSASPARRIKPSEASPLREPALLRGEEHEESAASLGEPAAGNSQAASEGAPSAPAVPAGSAPRQRSLPAGRASGSQSGRFGGHIGVTGDASISDEFDKAGRNRPVEMVVAGQNRRIGTRNVRWIGTRKKRTIGGNPSSYFIIFIVSLPGAIAEIEWDGESFVLTPLKPQFFPDLPGPLPNCLNRDIRILTPQGQSTTIRFRLWMSELEKVNRIMRMVRQPGLPDFDY